VITKKPSKPCGKCKILKQKHTKIDVSLLWRHSLFLDKSSASKNILTREILRWRTAMDRGKNKNPLVTVLSHNGLEDKISLVLVPLLASAGMRCLKLIWSDGSSGQAAFNNLLSFPGLVLPSKTEDIHRILERTGGVYAVVSESAPLLDTTLAVKGLEAITRFEVLSLFTIYAIRWKGIAADIRIGNDPNQTKAQKARDLAMNLKEHCEATGSGFSFFINNQNQPLGYALGPVLELREALDVLQAKGPPDLTKIALEVGSDLLMFRGQFSHRTEAKSFLKNQLLNGAAYARFKEIIQAFKVSEKAADDPFSLPPARREFRIASRRKGYIQRIAMDRLLDLKQKLCRENQQAGLLLLKKIGDTTDKNDLLAKAYLPSSWNTELIRAEVQDIYTISRFPPEFRPQIQEKIKGSFRF
jgi:pyrimidine-nucleoside phosphorylase